MKKHWRVNHGGASGIFTSRGDAIAAAEKVAKDNPGDEVTVYEFLGSFSLPKIPTWTAAAAELPTARIAG